MHWSYDLVQDRTQDLLREAAQRRLAREAMTPRTSAHILSRSAERLGHLLVQLGSRLSATPEPQNVTCCTPA
ncbi:MAG: hypothetical protein K8J31_10705 [Anaerolineae bacterium]|nr:hypothetical protein [Anaerolineae bacterium]